MGTCSIEDIKKGIIESAKSTLDGEDLSVHELNALLENIETAQVQHTAFVTNRATEGEFVNQSGGAIGADTVFGKIAAMYGSRSNHYYDSTSKNKPPENANTPITKEDTLEGKSKVTKAARRIGLLKKRGVISDSLLIRNWSQVKYADAIFAIAPITKKGDLIQRFRADKSGKSDDRRATEDTVSGGTAYAVEMAKGEGKPIYVYDDLQKLSTESKSVQTGQWHQWNYETKSWDKLEKPPTLTPNYAGIGSVSISKEGETAVKDLFKANFGEPTQAPKETLNIYDGSNENKHLSNFAHRPFDGFYSVEQYFQAAKADYAPATEANKAILAEIMKTTSGKQLRILGRKFNQFDVEEWDNDAADHMYDGIRASFEGNTSALMSTGTATLTHTQDKSRWGKDFPKILMAIREEFRAAITPPKIAEVELPKGYTTSDENIYAMPAREDESYKEATTRRIAAHNKGQGIFVMRVYPSMDIRGENGSFHFGNPFGVSDTDTKATVPNAGTGPEVSLLYKEWLEGTAYMDIEPARRDWINQQIELGVLDGRELIYFKDESGLTHAKILRDMVKLRPKTRKKGVVQGVKEYFDRASVEADTSNLYLFTDNANRTSGKTRVDPNSAYAKKYGIDSKYPSVTQALVRGLDNAMPITTMKTQNKENWKESDFAEFKEIIDDDIESIAQVQKQYNNIIFNNENKIGQGKYATLPQHLQNYLDMKLAQIGIENGDTKPYVEKTIEIDYAKKGSNVTSTYIETPTTTVIGKNTAGEGQYDNETGEYKDFNDVIGTAKAENYNSNGWIELPYTTKDSTQTKHFFINTATGTNKAKTWKFEELIGYAPQTEVNQVTKEGDGWVEASGNPIVVYGDDKKDLKGFAKDFTKDGIAYRVMYDTKSNTFRIVAPEYGLTVTDAYGMYDETVVDFEDSLKGLTKDEIVETFKETVASYDTMYVNKEQLGEYEIAPDIQANEDQKAAIDTLGEFIADKTPGNNIYVLEGAGGTGKTSVVAKIANKAIDNGMTVMYLAPTNKAASVLTVSAGIKANTVDSALKRIFKDGQMQNTGEEVDKASVVIIDEGSMISDAQFERIMTQELASTKYIFMGDAFQLPPIENEKGADSVVFREYKDKTVTLTKVERQKPNSPVTKTTKRIRGNLGNSTVERGVKLQMGIDPMRTDESNDDGSVTYSPPTTALLDKFIEEFAIDPLNARFITYKNEKLKPIIDKTSVYYLNKTIREKIYPDSPLEYRKGDVIMAYNPFSSNKVEVLSNASEYTLLEAKAPTPFVYEQTIGNQTISIKGAQQRVFIQNIQGGKKREIVLVDKDTMAVLEQEVSNLWDQYRIQRNNGNRDAANMLRKAAVTMSKNMEENYPSVEFSYAITTHKSQGSTYKNVYVMEDSIAQVFIKGGTQDEIIKLKNQYMYVAVSRTSDNLTIVSNKSFSGNKSQSTEAYTERMGSVGSEQANNVIPIVGPNPVVAPAAFKDGDSIDVFSEIIVKNPDGADYHVTWDFNPQTAGNPTSPAMIAPDGKNMKVKVVGTYKDNDMEYDVVEITVNGKIYTHQPSGTPLHMTKYVNKDNGIRPMDTGTHAQAGKYTKVEKGKTVKGTSHMFKGKYNSKFDRSIPKMGSTENGTFDESTRVLDTTPFALDDSMIEIAQDLANIDIQNIAAENITHLLELVDKYNAVFAQMGIDGPNLTLDVFNSAKDKQEEVYTKGDADITTGNIRLDLGNNGSFSGRLEIFVHEVQHILIEKAMQASPKLRKTVKTLRKQMAKKLDVDGKGYEMFLDGKPHPTSSQVEYAKEMYEYIFHNPKSPESEFLAYASTNQYMQTQLGKITFKDGMFGQFDEVMGKSKSGRDKKTLGYTLKKLVNKLIEIVNLMVGAFDYEGQKGKEVIDDVLSRLLNIAAAASKAESLPEAPTSKFTEMYNKADKKAVELVKRITEGKKKRVSKSLTAAQLLAAKPNKDGVSEWINRATSKGKLLQIKQVILRNNILTGVFRDTADPEVSWFYDMFRQSKAQVDQEVQELKHETVRSLLEGFESKNGLQEFMTQDPKTGKYDESILQSIKKSLLNIDYIAISDDVTELIPFLEDTTKAYEAIKDLEKVIGNEEAVLAAKRLGMKLVKGVDTDVNGYINTHEIVRAYKLDFDKIEAIDQLATLFALVKTGKEDRDNTVTALKQNSTAIQNAMDVYYADRKELHDTVYSNGREVLEEKGFHIKHKEGNKVQHIIPADEYKALIKGGMKPIKDVNSPMNKLEKTLLDVTGERYYIVAGTDLETAYTQGLINTVQIKAEGESLKKLLRNLNFTTEDIQGKIEALAKRKPAKTVIENETEMTPERALTGQVVDYLIRISDKDAETHLGLNDNLANVIANTAGNLGHKQKAIKSNLNAVNKMYDYAKSKYKGNEESFTLLRGTTDEERNKGKEYEYAHQWNLIPDYARREIERISGNRSILIPNSMLVDFSGYKDVSITDAKILSSNPRIKAGVRKVEKFWMELIGLAKKSIVTKMYSVIKNNAMSNMVVTMIRARILNPFEYFDQFRSGWESVNQYQADTRELIRLEIQKRAGQETPQGRIDSLKAQLEDNIVHPIMADGQYSSILEDIDFSNVTDDSLITEATDKLFSKMPVGSKAIADTVFMTNKSWIYQKVVKLTTMNDAVNRSILEQNGVDLHETDKIFVNYGYLQNRWLKWVENMGFVMFTKYTERSLSAMATFVKKNPLALGLFAGGRQITGVDLETPIDSYFDITDTLMNKFHGDDAWDVMKHGLFPFMFYLD